MNREKVTEEILSLPNNNILAELPTSFGKSRIAIELMKHRNAERILIVVPRNVLKNNWADELKHWGAKDYNVTFTTYVSLPKYAGKWDMAIFDECFRGDTEILTSKGYRRFDVLTEEDLVAQYTDAGQIEFVKPLRLIRKPYAGELCKLTLGRGRNCYMTPNHNQVYVSPLGKVKVSPIKDLFLHGKKFVVSGKGSGNNTPLSWMERLLIAIQADGTLQRHQINESVYSIQVSKPRKRERLLNILSYTNNYTTIKGREEVDRYMCKLPKGDAKLLSTHFSLNMGYNRANSFIDEIVQWDGSLSMGNTLYYSSKEEENADFVAAVAIQAGYKVLQSVEEDDRKKEFSTIHKVYMRKITTTDAQVMKKTYIPYTGNVYCVEVPSHKIVVRSEGYTFVSGNCHHLSERCREALCSFNIKYSILLSATVGKELKDEVKEIFDDLYCYRVSVKSAIKSEVLPDPRVILFPLTLDNMTMSEHIIVNPKTKGPTITYPYKMLWTAKRDKKHRYNICCTPRQYYNEMSSKIDWYKNKRYITAMKNIWLHMCGERLKWLSDKKIHIVKQIMNQLSLHRTLTFCNSIEQTELLGKHCINSKNKDSLKVLEDFNKGNISQITAVNMLNEGINLANCRVGIYGNLNSSETIIKQRLGRLLRHPNPVIIIPYFANTREEELVTKMLEDYNPELVSTINFVEEIMI